MPFGCNIGFRYSNDLDVKLSFFNIFVVQSREERKETILKLYEVMAMPTLLHELEYWTLN